MKKHERDGARHLEVLEEVAKAGGMVAADRFREIGRSLGYTRRGLGGFFVGDAPLERVRDTVRVTDQGFRLLDAKMHEDLRAHGRRWRPLLPLKPLFKIEGKSLGQTIIEMRNEEYENSPYG